MSPQPQWPLCLRLRAGEVRLVLPAGLFQQVLACSALTVPGCEAGGWRWLDDEAGSTLGRIAIGRAGDGPWRATWLAVLRRLPREMCAGRRLALVLSEAPRVLPPLAVHEAVSLVPGSAPAPGLGLGSLRIDGEDLLVPDLDALAARIPSASGAP